MAPMRLALLLALLLPSLPSTARAQEVRPRPRTHAFAEVGGRELELDLYRAEAGSPTPLVLWIHGGAWRAGDRKQVPDSVLALVARGISVASIDYRLTSQAGRWGDEPVHWPAQRNDAKAAVRWLRAHAEELNLDEGAFVAWGASAGGHLATILGLTNDAPGTTGSVGEHTDTSSAVALAINFYGPTDLFELDADVTEPPGSAIHHDAPDSPESMVLGVGVHGHSLADIRAHSEDPAEPWPALLALARSASPVHAVDAAHAAPLFTAHGRRDRLIAFAQAERLHERLEALELPTTFHPVERAGHGFGPAIHREAIRWMTEQLSAEAAEPATSSDGDQLLEDAGPWALVLVSPGKQARTRSAMAVQGVSRRSSHQAVRPWSCSRRAQTARVGSRTTSWNTRAEVISAATRAPAATSSAAMPSEMARFVSTKAKN